MECMFSILLALTPLPGEWHNLCLVSQKERWCKENAGNSQGS